jgi:hypothetical protein
MQSPPAPAASAQIVWGEHEDLTILSCVRKLGTQWPLIALELPGRTPDAVRNRWHRLQQTHLLTDEMHQKRVHEAAGALLLASGDRSTVEVDLENTNSSDKANTCIKGADHGRAMWSPQEDALIEDGVKRFGCRWRQIAAALPGRSDSSVRNRWMRMLKDREQMKSQNEVLRREQRVDPTMRPVPMPSMRPLASMPPTEMLAARIADAQINPPRSAPPNAEAVSMLAGRIADASTSALCIGWDQIVPASLPSGAGFPSLEAMRQANLTSGWAQVAE